eukprot:1158541-Pelagomonas_calceolata.AAC.5
MHLSMITDCTRHGVHFAMCSKCADSCFAQGLRAGALDQKLEPASAHFRALAEACFTTLSSGLCSTRPSNSLLTTTTHTSQPLRLIGNQLPMIGKGYLPITGQGNHMNKFLLIGAVLYTA